MQSAKERRFGLNVAAVETMTVRGTLVTLAGVALAGALMGAAALAERSPAIGLPLAIATGALILWLLLQSGADL